MRAPTAWLTGLAGSDTLTQMLPRTGEGQVLRKLVVAAAPWAGYLAWLVAAELTVSLGHPLLGMLMHLALLLALTAHATLATAERRPLLLALTLAPLIRVLSLALPLAGLPLIWWYLITSIPLLLASYLMIRRLSLAPNDVGLRLGRLPNQLALALVGFPLGATEYLILRPKPLLAGGSWPRLLLGALGLVVATGFVEELIFRGILQRTAASALGRWGVLYVSAVFATLHIGYLSVADLAFVFAVALLFAGIVAGSGSLLGVTLAHGITNVGLYLIFPLLFAGTALAPLRDSQPSQPLTAMIPTAITPINGSSVIPDVPETRLFASLTPLTSGKLLVAGGHDVRGVSAMAEIYDTATRQWTLAAPMTTPRQLHTAVRLADGRVLISGGVDATGSALASAEIYDPAANAWQPVPPMSVPRSHHSATLLPDGRVLVAGGNGPSASGAEASAEIFDPRSKAWAPTGWMHSARAGQTATLQPDGTVLVRGGVASGQGQDEVYDPRAGSWSLR